MAPAHLSFASTASRVVDLMSLYLAVSYAPPCVRLLVSLVWSIITGNTDPDPASGTRRAALYRLLCHPMLLPCTAVPCPATYTLQHLLPLLGMQASQEFLIAQCPGRAHLHETGQACCRRGGLACNVLTSCLAICISNQGICKPRQNFLHLCLPAMHT